MTAPLLDLDRVTYRYDDGTCALNDCSLTIRRGSRVAVLGANGAGKTTLLFHLNGIFRPATGSLLLDGAPFDYSRSGLHTLRSRVGMVFQNPDNQLFSASVREDVSFGPMNLGLPPSEVARRVEEALAAVGMTGAADRPVHNLSFGQKKRVCIAGVLAMEPDVLVLDEPMAGLDMTMQRELTELLEAQHRKGMTIVIAGHDLDFAYGWADDVLVLSGGTLLASGRPEEVLYRQDVRQVLGNAPLAAELVRVLSLHGIELRGNGYVPRSRQQLLDALENLAPQEDRHP